jgi:D-glycero-D-manno-heptose 1,7-bisphosphate phosphatase
MPAGNNGERILQEKAVFLDRDGVINDLIYFEKEGTIGSPLRAKDLRVFDYAASSIKSIQSLGYKVVLISNQPGVAKRQFSYEEFLKMKKKMHRELGKTKLDGEYYCLHHPSALISKYKKNCDCRKPKPGLFYQASREMNIDLSKSYYVGDSLVDVKAGRAAGVKTILVAHVTEFLNKMIEFEKAEPDYVVASLKDVPVLLQSVR